MRYGFEATLDEIVANPEPYVTGVFECLVSEFLTMPRGDGFLNYDEFERAYEELKQATGGFADLGVDAVLSAATRRPVVLIVLRTILGFTPPEWAAVTRQRTSCDVSQGHVRSLDRAIRMAPTRKLSENPAQRHRVQCLVDVGCQLLREGAPDVLGTELHRLDKADTREGLASLRTASQIGVPYAMLLYERLLGRPFAGHRDSVSELVGDSVEIAVEQRLTAAGVSYRKTKRAERIAGFDQAPDFVVPSEFSPQVVIEAKLSADDGTARDKVTRIQHLAAISRQRTVGGGSPFQVVACIAGAGFAVRREDMRKLLVATGGKVFTLTTLDRMIACTRLAEYVPRQ